MRPMADLPESAAVDWTGRPTLLLSRDIRARKLDDGWLVHFRADAPANFGLEIGDAAFALLASFGRGKRFAPERDSALTDLVRAFADPGMLVACNFRIGGHRVRIGLDEMVQLRRTVSTDLIGLLELETVLLYLLARTNPFSEPICELGSLLGGSAIALALGARGSAGHNRTLCVDDHQWHAHMGDKPIPRQLVDSLPSSLAAFNANVADAGVGDEVVPIVCDTAEAARRHDGAISMLFMDASHEVAGLEAEFAAWFPKLRPGGYLVVHDYGNSEWPDVKPVVQGMLKAFASFSVVQTMAIATKAG
jgi:predicted O-methyltransferase YrrM